MENGDIPSRGPGNTRPFNSARQCRLSGWRARELSRVWLVCLSALLSPHFKGEVTLTVTILDSDSALPVPGPA
jgi:hypothetical protein